MKVAPSLLSIRSFFMVYALARSTMPDNIITERSTTDMAWSDRGLITAAPPTIIRMLAMFDPRTFPRAIWLRPLRAATMQVASSGSDVPAAMIVIAMNFSDRLRAWAMLVAELTNSFPPPTRQARPMMQNTRNYCLIALLFS